MIPSGSVASGEPSGGVVHPFTHESVGRPLRGGDRCGIAGGVGDATADTSTDGDGARDGVAAAVTPEERSASHAAGASTATTRTNGSTRNLRIEVAIPWRTAPEDTVGVRV
jgi:hypothetical protein